MKFTEIKHQNQKALRSLLKEKELNLFELKIKLRTMQQTNTSELRNVKKDIARIQTALTMLRKGDE